MLGGGHRVNRVTGKDPRSSGSATVREVRDLSSWLVEDPETACGCTGHWDNSSISLTF